jgi:hypothetical protein
MVDKNKKNTREALKRTKIKKNKCLQSAAITYIHSSLYLYRIV